MPRIKEVTDAGDDVVLAQIFEQEKAAFGEPLNTTKIWAHCPSILKASKELGAAIDRSGLLPASLRSLVYLRVATLNGCPF